MSNYFIDPRIREEILSTLASMQVELAKMRGCCDRIIDRTLCYESTKVPNLDSDFSGSMATVDISKSDSEDEAIHSLQTEIVSSPEDNNIISSSILSVESSMESLVIHNKGTSSPDKLVQPSKIGSDIVMHVSSKIVTHEATFMYVDDLPIARESFQLSARVVDMIPYQNVIASTVEFTKPVVTPYIWITLEGWPPPAKGSFFSGTTNSSPIKISFPAIDSRFESNIYASITNVWATKLSRLVVRITEDSQADTSMIIESSNVTLQKGTLFVYTHCIPGLRVATTPPGLMLTSTCGFLAITDTLRSGPSVFIRTICKSDDSTSTGAVKSIENVATVRDMGHKTVVVNIMGVSPNFVVPSMNRHSFPVNQQVRHLLAFKGGTRILMSGIGSGRSKVKFLPHHIIFSPDSVSSSVFKGPSEKQHSTFTIVGVDLRRTSSSHYHITRHIGGHDKKDAYFYAKYATNSSLNIPMQHIMMKNDSSNSSVGIHNRRYYVVRKEVTHFTFLESLSNEFSSATSVPLASGFPDTTFISGKVEYIARQSELPDMQISVKPAPYNLWGISVWTVVDYPMGKLCLRLFRDVEFRLSFSDLIHKMKIQSATEMRKRVSVSNMGFDPGIMCTLLYTAVENLEFYHPTVIWIICSHAFYDCQRLLVFAPSIGGKYLGIQGINTVREVLYKLVFCARMVANRSTLMGYVWCCSWCLTLDPCRVYDIVALKNIYHRAINILTGSAMHFFDPSIYYFHLIALEVLHVCARWEGIRFSEWPPPMLHLHEYTSDNVRKSPHVCEVVLKVHFSSWYFGNMMRLDSKYMATADLTEIELSYDMFTKPDDPPATIIVVTLGSGFSNLSVSTGRRLSTADLFHNFTLNDSLQDFFKLSEIPSQMLSNFQQEWWPDILHLHGITYLNAVPQAKNICTLPHGTPPTEMQFDDYKSERNSSDIYMDLDEIYITISAGSKPWKASSLLKKSAQCVIPLHTSYKQAAAIIFSVNLSLSYSKVLSLVTETLSRPQQCSIQRPRYNIHVTQQLVFRSTSNTIWLHSLCEAWVIHNAIPIRVWNGLAGFLMIVGSGTLLELLWLIAWHSYLTTCICGGAILADHGFFHILFCFFDP